MITGAIFKPKCKCSNLERCREPGHSREYSSRSPSSPTLPLPHTSLPHFSAFSYLICILFSAAAFHPATASILCHPVYFVWTDPSLFSPPTSAVRKTRTLIGGTFHCKSWRMLLRHSSSSCIVHFRSYRLILKSKLLYFSAPLQQTKSAAEKICVSPGREVVCVGVEEWKWEAAACGKRGLSWRLVPGR